MCCSAGADTRVVLAGIIQSWDSVHCNIHFPVLQSVKELSYIIASLTFKYSNAQLQDKCLSKVTTG